jgi:hypothetical protein
MMPAVEVAAATERKPQRRTVAVSIVGIRIIVVGVRVVAVALKHPAAVEMATMPPTPTIGYGL